jgi:molybdate transport system substrate-binding protein
VFVRNSLVVIVPKSNPKHIASLPDLGLPGVNLVLAAPAVPVGKYARAAFTVMATDAAFGPDFLARITANIKSNEVDVKAVAAKVSLGEADAGVVYPTDVTPRVAARVRIIEVPAPFNQIASYPIAPARTPRWRKSSSTTCGRPPGKRYWRRTASSPAAPRAVTPHH